MFLNLLKELGIINVGMFLYLILNLKKYNVGVVILEEIYFSIFGNFFSYLVLFVCFSLCI